MTTQRMAAQGWTIRAVADRAGVSLGTVSNVLNRPERVAEATRVRVQAAIDELGFVRNASAHQLRAGKSLGVGLVVIDVANPFFTELARGAEDAANEAGLVVILCNSDGSVEKEDKYITLLEEQRVAGVLISPVEKVPAGLRRLRERGTATVLLDGPRRRAGHCSVEVDDVYGGQIAAEHLVELGHRRIGLVNGPLTIHPCADRRRGFFAGLESARPKPLVFEILATGMNVSAGEDAAAELAAMRKPPTAVFCINDMLAVGLLRGLLSRGVRVPEDIAIVGYDDVIFAASASVALTSVRQPAYEIGRTGMTLLLDEARGAAHKHQHILFRPELVVRASTTARLATSAPLPVA